jgi:hypothetical protein
MTSFQIIKNLLESKEKKLSDSSINMYLRNLKKLNEDDEWKNLNFLKKTDNIINQISKFKESTQKNYYSSIVSVLKEVKGYKKYYDIYFKLMMELKNKLDDDLASNKINEKQSEKWGNIKWDDIIDIYNKLTDDIKLIKKSDMKKENKYNKLLYWFVSSFYVLLPPRRNQDIQNLSLTDSNKNKVDLDNKTIKFNIFKTSKTTNDDDKVIKISDDLINVIKYWMKMTGIKTGDLLVGFNNKELNQVNSINRILNKIFKVGSSDLRHIYLSSKYGNTLEEMKNDSKIMAHNTDTQRDYIKL